jgi:alpha-beta hydrolase superfamily lysophospholipase
MTGGTFAGVDGLKIFTREWRPAGEPHGVVIISHGFNVHSGQYEWVAQQLTAKGLAGGVIACGYTLEHQDEIAGLLCEDFAYQVPAPDVALTFLKGVGLLTPHARVFTLPLLILHGTADEVTKASGSKELYEKAGSKDETLKLYEGHFHDLLADVGKEQVMADIQAWLGARMGTELPRRGRELRT